MKQNWRMAILTCAATLLSGSGAIAQLQEAEFQTKWLFNGGKLVPITAKSKPGNTYVLGISTATVGNTSASTPERKAPYAFPMASDNNPVQVGTSPTALAGARMDTTGVDGNGWFNYTLLLGVGTLGVGPFTDNASGIARGGDPQVIDSVGMFSAQLGLGQGSKLFSNDPANDTGTAHFELGAPDLVGPLATIDLATDLNHSVTANATFASDPRLKFYMPDSTTEISDPKSYLESLLQGSSSGLGSSAGLTTDLALFDYSYDLTNTPGAAGAAFTSSGINTVVSAHGVPEPGSLAYLVVALPALATASRRMLRRRFCP